jgi:hypothetical protein
LLRERRPRVSQLAAEAREAGIITRTSFLDPGAIMFRTLLA